mmetsp:Transcript_90635/g.194348  ORF Transcript_90635/g.194348 Transcript_90635/m.194348 type:complete len:254 (-) Transcript_90635:76-837(-)
MVLSSVAPPCVLGRIVDMIVYDFAESIIGIYMVLRRICRHCVPKNRAIEATIETGSAIRAPRCLVNLPSQIVMVKHHLLIQLPCVVPLALLWSSINHEAQFARSKEGKDLFQNHTWCIVVELGPRVRCNKLHQGSHRMKLLNELQLQILVLCLVELRPIFQKRDAANVRNQKQLLASGLLSNHGDVVFNVEATEVKNIIGAIVFPDLSVLHHMIPVACVKCIEGIKCNDREVRKEFITKIAEPFAIADTEIND